MSQEDLARTLAARGIAIDRSAIARIENGDRYVLDYEAAEIAALFQVTVDALFEHRGGPVEKNRTAT